MWLGNHHIYNSYHIPVKFTHIVIHDFWQGNPKEYNKNIQSNIHGEWCFCFLLQQTIWKNIFLIFFAPWNFFVFHVSVSHYSRYIYRLVMKNKTSLCTTLTGNLAKRMEKLIWIHSEEVKMKIKYSIVFDILLHLCRTWEMAELMQHERRRMRWFSEFYAAYDDDVYDLDEGEKEKFDIHVTLM